MYLKAGQEKTRMPGKKKEQIQNEVDIPVVKGVSGVGDAFKPHGS